MSGEAGAGLGEVSGAAAGSAGRVLTVEMTDIGGIRGPQNKTLQSDQTLNEQNKKAGVREKNKIK